MIAPKNRNRVLAGRYRLVEALGSGGMGTVWLAEDDLLHRRVAVKEVSPPSEMNESEREMLRQRTLREARTAARLSHPNVVTIYDVVEDGDQPWIVMQLVSARSLRDIVQEDGPLTPQQTARVALQVLAALRAAHALGIVHRDVKPGNVLIESDGRAVLADFGIARAQDSSTITTSGVIVGSPSYIAPERAYGERGGPESDLWSLGATIYAAVEGRPPYDRASALATLAAVVTEDPDPSSRSGLLWPVISGLLRRDPASRLRPADAERMLRSIAGTDDIPATTPLPASTDRGIPGVAGTTGRLEHAERTRAFHPHIPQPTTPHPAEAVAPPYNATGEDVTPTPPAGLSLPLEDALPGTSTVPSTSGHPPPTVSPADSAQPRTGIAEPGAGTAEPGAGSTEPGAGIAEPGSGIAEPGAGTAEPGSGIAEPGAGTAEPGSGIAEPRVGSQPPRPEHPDGAGPDLMTASPPAQQPVPTPSSTSEPSAEHPSPTPSGNAPVRAEQALVPGMADRSASAPEPREGRVSKQRRRLGWVVIAVTALVAATGTLLALNMSGRHAALAPTRPHHSAAPPTAPKPTASGPSPSPGSSTAPPSRPSAGAQAAVPAGYHRYRDATGFSIAVPDGWAVSHQGNYVYVAPPSKGSFLLIDQSGHPNPNPLADWRQQEANRIGTYPGYHRIRLQAINYPQAEKAADWEFTYYRSGILTHVLNRNILANSKHAYALYWSTPETEWNADFHIFEVFARTFQPAAP